MALNKRWEWIGSAVAILVVAVIVVAIYKAPYVPQKPVEIPPSGPIVVHGQLVCLPHRDQSGPQTLECAFGVLDTRGRYFALRDTDAQYGNLSGVPTNVPIRVEGTFTPRDDTKYQSIGVIAVTSIARDDTPQHVTLAGVYLCLPHTNSSGPQTEECAYGLQTDDGYYYALDFGPLSQQVPTLKSGDRISANGIFVPVEQLDSDHWKQYPIKGIFSVTDSLKIVSHSEGTTGITGVVLLGPTCPVLRDPPEPQCADKPYKATLVLASADQATVFATFSSNEYGVFRVAAAPGVYTVRSAAATNILPYCASNGTITVRSGGYTQANIYCDTGIR